MKLFFINLLLVLISVVEVGTLLMIHILEFWFQRNLKNMNAKVFHLMSRVHETRFLVHPESCQCEPNESVCNSKQKWNHDKCPCNCKKFDG